MKLFGKKEDKGNILVSECACKGPVKDEKTFGGCSCGSSDITSVKVLGSGCKSCHELNEAAIAAVKELGMALEVEYITDMEKIMGYGVMSMPALVINEKVVSAGKALKTADIIKLLKKLGYC